MPAQHLALKLGAAVFLIATCAYSVGLIYYNRHSFPTATAGATYRFSDADRAMRVTAVTPEGAAERAGLAVGELIIAVDGRVISSSYPVWDAIDRGQPGDIVSLAVRRPGDAEVRTVRLSLDPVVLPTTIGGSAVTPMRLAALEILSFYPLPFLAVAAFVLLQRPQDRHAWLLVVMFTSFIAGQRPLELEPVIHPVLRKPLIAYCLLWAIVPPGALYSFFATFPEPTPIEKRLPWLKVALLGCPLLAGACLAVVTMISSETPSYLRPQGLSEAYETRLGFALGMYSLAGYGFGFASLAWNAFRARPEIRRRTQVMLWGTAGALLPLIAVGTYAAVRGLSYIDVPFWLWVGPLLALFLLPVSFAYAVVKHRVMEIPVLLRRSARYVMVRHAIVTTGIVIGVALTFLFAAVFSRVLPDDGGRTSASRSAMPAAIDESGHRSTQSERQALSAVAGAVFGVIVVVATRKGVRKVTDGSIARSSARPTTHAAFFRTSLARHEPPRTGTSSHRCSNGPLRTRCIRAPLRCCCVHRPVASSQPRRGRESTCRALTRPRSNLNPPCDPGSSWYGRATSLRRCNRSR